MRKCFIVSVFLFVEMICLAQKPTDFSAVDKHALKAPKSVENDLPKLSEYLSKNCSGDFEKVRSFYSWIVNNISYDNAAVGANAKRINHSIQDILNRKKAICQGYSNLFQEMCNRSGITCEVVAGYPKTPHDKPPDLSKANHTWNAVLLNGNWYLLDVTWGAGNNKAQLEDYFLTTPEVFIIDHLPNDPMWQLLNCPISTVIFQKKEENISNYIAKTDSCFNYQDSIRQWMSLSRSEKKLKNAINAYQFNPVEENKKYLGSMYMDMVSDLSDLSSELELLDSAEAVMNIQMEIIDICEKASLYIELYPHQKENLAYTHFNYAVALSRRLNDLKDQKDKSLIVDTYNKMLYHFETGKAILVEVPPNPLSENGIKQFDEYIEFVRSKLKTYQ